MEDELRHMQFYTLNGKFWSRPSPISQSRGALQGQAALGECKQISRPVRQLVGTMAAIRKYLWKCLNDEESIVLLCLATSRAFWQRCEFKSLTSLTSTRIELTSWYFFAWCSISFITQRCHFTDWRDNILSYIDVLQIKLFMKDMTEFMKHPENKVYILSQSTSRFNQASGHGVKTASLQSLWERHINERKIAPKWPDIFPDLGLENRDT